MELKRILELAFECEKELDAIMPITQKITYEGFRAKKTYGNARRIIGDNWLIKINLNMLNEEEVKNTIIHEILHTYPDCQCHTGEWKRRANIVKRKLGYDITRTSSKELDLSITKPKYRIECTKCGKVYNYYKKCWWFDRLSECSCGKCRTNNLKFKG